MEVQYLFYVIIFLIILSLFKNVSYIFYMYILFSAFTTFGLFIIGNNSIIAYHLIFVFLFMRVFSKLQYDSYYIKQIIYFTIYCGIAILFSLFNHDVVVLNIQDNWDYIEFSLTQVTQYFYLIIAVCSMIITYTLLKEKKVSLNHMEDFIKITAIIVIFIGIFQLFIPIDIFNFLFRNTVNAGNQTMQGVVRITSTFNEASFLAFFLCPVFCVSIYNLSNNFNFLDAVIVAGGFYITIMNNSSSFYLGLSIGILCLFFSKLYVYFLGKRKKVNKNRLIAGSIFLLLIIGATIFYSDILSEALLIVTRKISGEGVSGNTRSYALAYHLNIFKEHFFIGVGYGTIRSYDLFSTWLAELGIIGTLLYFIPIIRIIYKLIKINTYQSNRIFLLLIVSNIILLSSVPEPYFVFYWIYYGMAAYYVKCSEVKKDENTYC